MRKPPRLRIEKLSSEPAEIVSLEEARNFPYNEGLIIVVEGHMISSYDDFRKLIEEQDLKNQEFIEVKFLPLVIGG